MLEDLIVVLNVKVALRMCRSVLRCAERGNHCSGIAMAFIPQRGWVSCVMTDMYV